MEQLSAYTLDIAPLVSTPLFIGLGVMLGIGICASLFFKKQRGVARALVLALCALALTNPSIVNENRERVNDVVAVIVDESASQTLGGRQAQTQAALEHMQAQLASLPHLEVRVKTLPPLSTQQGSEDVGTPLLGLLNKTLSDVPHSRIAGAILITDGIVHDVPSTPSVFPLKAPLHVLLTGKQDDKDRKITLLDAPRFGLVGKESTLRLRIDETHSLGKNAQTAQLTVRQDGAMKQRLQVRVGEMQSINITLDHAGTTIIEMDVEPLEGELTLLNNKLVVNMEGVREKLNVLLVSGEPHAGERTWRNLLKSDANVDLVHFTILRPPEKLDGTPIHELALIAFPTRELFQVKIKQFDLIILDRYADQRILPLPYYDNIARYVAEGGALLVAAGPEFAGSSSIATTPLAPALPASPSGQVFETPFKPQLTSQGERHPVTRDLKGAFPLEKPQWGEWQRLIGSQSVRGITVMSDASKRPLLVLSHEGKGRVGMLLSDHAWLWARGYQEGGPHVDLLRRMSHWLMKEPELEEEALRAFSRNGDVLIERQSMQEITQPARITFPDGSIRDVPLVTSRAGVFTARVPSPISGLVRIEHGSLTTAVGVGSLHNKELEDVISTQERLLPLVEKTKGSLHRLAREGTAQLNLPSIQRVSAQTPRDENIIQLVSQESSRLLGIRFEPLIMGLLGLLTLLFPMIIMWVWEGRGKKALKRS
jgi:hypothetical protein